jgi:hypothetical protein
LARTGWGIRSEADRRPITPTAAGLKFVAGFVPQAIEEGQAHYLANDRLREMAGVAAWDTTRRSAKAYPQSSSLAPI